jgi:xylan 1,4-beta-xylosidase
MPESIRNPILPGFHPDPSIVRVSDDYYVATSTFEWFPGVALFHSRDLAHWRPIGHALTRRAQLDLPGVGDSAGPWAPSLSHDGERFYLVVCQVRTRTGPFKDMRVMLYTADRIEGPWDDGVFLGGSGFDPSLFHDPTTGRKWLANIQWDYRSGVPTRFAGIVLQQYDPARRRLVGELKTVLAKPQLCEGPNLYWRDGWYYLMLAEGGTGWNHGISMARSRDLLGAYELDPQPLVLTSRASPGNALQKAGHGELVETPAGETYLVHLAASRVAYPDRRSLLGRETCLQKVAWSPDGWLRLAHGGTDPLVDVPAPASLARHPWPPEPARDAFDGDRLSPHWQSLRAPVEPSWCELRGGSLRLRGRESIASLFEQSLVARRIESTRCVATTKLAFAPTHFTQSAGLIVYYDTRQHAYLRVTRHESLGRIVELVQTDDGVYSEMHATRLAIPGWDDAVYLRATVEEASLRFAASRDGEAWHDVGGPLDFSRIGDDYGSTLRFTGPMVGVCCQDLNEAAVVAEFEFFELRNSVD